RHLSEAHRELRKKLETSNDTKRREMLSAHVREQIVAVLNLPESVQLNSQQGFFDLGMDSLMATELRNRLQSSLDMSLPPTIALENGTLEALSNYLSDTFAAPSREAAVSEATDENLEPLLSEIENLSDTEIDRVLAAWAGQESGEGQQ